MRRVLLFRYAQNVILDYVFLEWISTPRYVRSRPVETCRDSHWRRHRLLCTGALSEEDAESSPLFQFKVHACQTNSIFLLVADVFARICDDVERMRSEGSLDETAIISRALEPYSRFVRNLWWDAVSAESESLNEVEMDGTREKDDLVGTLKLLVHDSWDLLRKALDLDRRGLTEVLSTEYFSR
jgi:hypothetical protein